MLNEEERLAIVKDVIARIRGGFYVPTKGTYLTMNKIRAEMEYGLHADASKVLPEFFKHETCMVCNIGGLFLSTVMLKNKLPLSGVLITRGGEGAACYTYLSQFFSVEQLCMIESAFEVSERMSPLAETLKEMDAFEESITYAIRFGKRYSYADERMLAILNNMLENKGLFDPLQDLDEQGRPVQERHL